MTASSSPQVRLILVGALFLGCASVLSYRLFIYQHLDHERYTRLASDHHRDTVKIVPRRGSLLDTNGHPLAVSVSFGAVQVVGKEIGRPEEVATALAPILELPITEILSRIDPTNERPVVVKDKLPAAVADR